VAVVFKTVCAEESFEEIFAKIAHGLLTYAANTCGYIA
jgi:hypothetical protein